MYVVVGRRHWSLVLCAEEKKPDSLRSTGWSFGWFLGGHSWQFLNDHIDNDHFLLIILNSSSSIFVLKRNKSDCPRSPWPNPTIKSIQVWHCEIWCEMDLIKEINLFLPFGSHRYTTDERFYLEPENGSEVLVIDRISDSIHHESAF